MLRTTKKIFSKYIIEKYICPGCSNYNSLEARRASRSKKQGRDMFDAHNIPYAKGDVFFSPFRALKFIEKNGFPVVIKPNRGGFSRGSYFPIRTKKELWKAIFLARFYWPWLVIENYAEGENYRITVVDDKIIAAAKRYEPFVDGDGKHTITQLIETENKIREGMNIYPVMHEIRVDAKTHAYLKKQKLTLQSVPEKNQRVKLFHRVALSPGGVIGTIDTATITKKNEILLKKILKLFNARVFGVDFIMEKGPHIDWDKQACAVLEVNSRPYMKLHEYPRFGEKPDLREYYDVLNSEENSDADIF